MKQVWLSATLKRPWLTMLIGLLLIAASGFGLKNLYFRGDYKVFFDQQNQQLQEFEKMQAVFNKTTSVQIVVAPDSGDVFDRESLQLIQQLTTDLWQTPFSSRVDSITNYQHTQADGDDLLVEALYPEGAELTPEKRAYIKAAALAEPNVVGRAVSASGHIAVINVTIQQPGHNQTKEVFEVAEFAKALTQRYIDQGAKAKFYHAGIITMNYSFASSAQKDASTIVPAMFIAIIIMLAILLRSLSGTIATTLVIIFSVIVTLGLFGWTGSYLSTATVNVPTIVMTLAVADCVHFIGTMLYGMRQNKSKSEAISYAMKINIMPIFITSVTTSIGFLSMNFSNVPIIRDFGNLTAVGVMVAFIFAVTLLPAMLQILPIKVNTERKTSGAMERYAEWLISHHKRVLAVMTVVSIVLSGFIVLNTVNDEATEYFSENTEFRQATTFMEDNISGMGTIDFSLETGKESGINSPEFLHTTADFVAWLQDQPEVDHVASITHIFKRLNQNMHGDDPSWYKLPEDQELAAQYLLMYEMSLPYGLDLNNQINLDKSSLRLIATMKNIGSTEYTEFEQRAKQWFTSHNNHIQISASSPSLMFAHIGEQNMQSMIVSYPAALLLISALLVFALGSLRLGVISLLPNILPATIGFGIWGLYSGQINLGLSVVAGMSLGIIVDDSVHFLTKYKIAKDEGKTTEDAVRYAFASVGRALWVTTLILTIGFSILGSSDFRLNSDMGLSAAVVLVVALTVDFLFLPAFLLVFDKKQQVKGQSINSSNS